LEKDLFLMGKIIGIVFFGAFAAMGIGFFIAGATPMISGWWSAKSWEPVQAELLEHKLTSSHSDDSTTYKATARYRYDFFGQVYVSDRVGFAGGSDNIGSYHQDMNRQLGRVSGGSQALNIWVNPNEPSEAVIDRDMRWGLFAFKSLFLFLFGGTGLGGLYAMYRFRNLGEVRADADPARPWTQYNEWNRDTIMSNAKLGNTAMLVFALIWNLISWPTMFAIIEPVSKGELLPLVALLFPIVGTYLAWLWYKGNKAYKLTGPMPLKLDPYPASIGGQFGGLISLNSSDLNQVSDVQKNAKIKVEHVHTYTRGSGDNRKTYHDVIYEQSMVPSVVRVDGGLEIRFCFDLGDDHRVSDPPLDSPRKTWKVRLHAVANNGTTIEREYEDIPVFATSQTSSINDAQAYAATSHATAEASQELVQTVLEVQADTRGHRLNFPAYNSWSMLIFAAMGLIFVVIGLAIPSLVFNIVFPLLGGPLALAGVYTFARSLDVRVGAEGITSTRSLFGYAFKPKFLPSYSFKHFEKKKSSSSTSGNKTTDYYQVFAHGDDGTKILVAEALEGRAQADAAIEKLSSLQDYSN